MDLSTVTLHPVPLEIRKPFHGEALLIFLGRHAVPGVETYRDSMGANGRRIDYARTLRLPLGPAVVELTWAGELTAALRLSDERDVDSGRQRVVDLCDLDHDPVAVARHLGRDVDLGPLVAASPGLRVPGAVDAHEQLFRTMIGQQISLAGAANCAGKLVASFGEPYPTPDGRPLTTAAGELTSLFPSAAALATADPESLPMPRARGRGLVTMATALSSGAISLTRSADPAETRALLLACPGIGPWTADYVLMRALHAPDILLASDLVIKRELSRRQIGETASWSPWRSYATMHLWRAWTG